MQIFQIPELQEKLSGPDLVHVSNSSTPPGENWQLIHQSDGKFYYRKTTSEKYYISIIIDNEQLYVTKYYRMIENLYGIQQRFPLGVIGIQILLELSDQNVKTIEDTSFDIDYEQKKIIYRATKIDLSSQGIQYGSFQYRVGMDEGEVIMNNESCPIILTDNDTPFLSFYTKSGPHNVTRLNNCFTDETSLAYTKYLDLSKWDLSKIENATSFINASCLENIDFPECELLESIRLDNFLSNCNSLKSIYCPNDSLWAKIQDYIPKDCKRTTKKTIDAKTYPVKLLIDLNLSDIVKTDFTIVHNSNSTSRTWLPNSILLQVENFIKENGLVNVDDPGQSRCYCFERSFEAPDDNENYIYIRAFKTMQAPEGWGYEPSGDNNIDMVTRSYTGDEKIIIKKHNQPPTSLCVIDPMPAEMNIEKASWWGLFGSLDEKSIQTVVLEYLDCTGILNHHWGSHVNIEIINCVLDKNVPIMFSDHEITGLENLDFTGVNNVSEIFRYAYSVTEVYFNNLSASATMTNMFSEYDYLEKIYCSEEVAMKIIASDEAGLIDPKIWTYKINHLEKDQNLLDLQENLDEKLDNKALEVQPNVKLWEKGSKLSSTNRIWYDVCFGKGIFVASSTNYSKTAYSSDGITWTESNEIPSSNRVAGICFGKDRFIALCYNTNKAVYSTDGITWVLTEDLPMANSFYICYGNDRFMVVFDGSNKAAYSTDGITWVLTEDLPINGKWRVCYGNDRFMAVCYDSNKAAYSTNGITWVPTEDLPINGRWDVICYGNGRFMTMIQNAYTVAYSTDGAKWDLASELPHGQIYNNILYGNGLFIVNGTGSAVYSTDGMKWEKITHFATNRVSSICFGNNRFVAVGLMDYSAFCDTTKHQSENETIQYLLDKIYALETELKALKQ